MKKCFKGVDRIFAYHFISMGIFMLFFILLDFPIKMLFSAKGELTDLIIGIVTVCASLFVLCYRDGFHSTKLELKPFVFSMALFLLLLNAITCLLGLIGSAIYVSGPTNLLAEYVVNQAGLYFEERKTALFWYCPLFMTGAYLFLYAPLMVLGKYLGFRRKQAVFRA